MRKLFSLRMDVELLERLREQAEKEGVTVTTLIHDLLLKGLPGENARNDDDDDVIRRKDIEALIKAVERNASQNEIHVMGRRPYST